MLAIRVRVVAVAPIEVDFTYVMMFQYSLELFNACKPFEWLLNIVKFPFLINSLICRCVRNVYVLRCL